MTRIVAAAILAVLAGLTTPAKADIVEAKALLDEAVARASKNAEKQWAFTVDYNAIDKDGNEKRFKLRYDPRNDDPWTLLSPNYDTLSRKERKILKDMQKGGDSGEKPQDALIYKDLALDPETIALAEDTQTHAILTSRIVDPDTPKKIRKALRLSVRINKDKRYVEEIAVRAVEPFKPAPIAQITAFTQVQRFQPDATLGVVLLAGSEAVMKGSAMSRKFASSNSAVYSDYEIVDMR